MTEKIMSEDLKNIIEIIVDAKRDEEWSNYKEAKANAQIAIAYALVALCDRLDKLSFNSAMNPEEDNKPALRVIDTWKSL